MEVECVKRRFYLKQQERVNTFLPWIDSPGFSGRMKAWHSFFIFFADKSDEPGISESK
jgi:hypothetical protein